MPEPRLLEIDETNSTQDEAKAWLAQNPTAREPFWIRTRRQNSGRGRQSRTWISVDGDLLVSCAYAYGSSKQRKPMVTLVAGHALIESLRESYSLSESVFLKWPNDLYWEERPGKFRKLAGILAESAGSGRVVVGWGVNLPAGARDVSGAHAEPACLEDVFKSQGLSVKAPLAVDCLKALKVRFESELAAWEQEPLEYEKRLVRTLGEKSMKRLWGLEGVLLPSGESARMIELDASGAARVQVLTGAEAGKLKLVVSGEFQLKMNAY